jgi:hypothetical protein
LGREEIEIGMKDLRPLRDKQGEKSCPLLTGAPF